MDNLKQVSLYSPESYLFKYGVHQTSIPMRNKLSLSVNYPMINGYDNVFIERVNKEISTSIDKSIIHKMATDEDAINVVGDGEIIKSEKLFNYISRFDFIVISARIATLIDMSVNTNHTFSRGARFINEYAMIGKTKVYIDNFKKWDDSIIICGYNNSFTYNYQFHVIADDYSFSSFSPKLNYLLTYDIIPYRNFTKLYFLENKDEHYDKWISKIITENREKKLDILLK